MAVSETIAIIGASGQAGSLVARSLTGAHYRLLLMGRREDRLLPVLAAVLATQEVPDADILTCPEDACWEADAVILAVPAEAVGEVAAGIGPYATGKRIIVLVPDGAEDRIRKQAAALLPHSVVETATRPEEIPALLCRLPGDDGQNREKDVPGSPFFT